MEDLPLFDSEACEPTGRSVCLRCTRPQKVCICTWLPKTPQKLQRTSFIVLQHPNEIYRPMRTVAILEASLNSECLKIYRGRRFSAKSKYQELHTRLSTEKTVVLYPSKDSIPLEDTPKTVPCNFILIDGTWQQAREMYQQNQFLHDLTKVSINDVGSRYLIRKQPNDLCLSTLETAAIVTKLREQSSGISEVLLAALDAMCQIQIDHGDQVHQYGPKSD